MLARLPGTHLFMILNKSIIIIFINIFHVDVIYKQKTIPRAPPGKRVSEFACIDDGE